MYTDMTAMALSPAPTTIRMMRKIITTSPPVWVKTLLKKSVCPLGRSVTWTIRPGVVFWIAEAAPIWFAKGGGGGGGVYLAVEAKVVIVSAVLLSAAFRLLRWALTDGGKLTQHIGLSSFAVQLLPLHKLSAEIKLMYLGESQNPGIFRAVEHRALSVNVGMHLICVEKDAEFCCVVWWQARCFFSTVVLALLIRWGKVVRVPWRLLLENTCCKKTTSELQRCM